MAQYSGTTWDQDTQFGRMPTLKGEGEADVAVIGGGITGMTTAYLLAKAGYKVVVLEKDSIGRGATGMTTAFLTQYIDTEISDLITMVGREKAALIYESHAQAIDILGDIIRREEISCEFMRCSNYIYATTEKDRSLLEEERDAAHDIGLDLTYVEDSHLPFTQLPYLELPHQAKFHPLQYLLGLIPILGMRGVKIYDNSAVTEIRGNEVLTKEGKITAKHIVVATYAPFTNDLYFKKAFYTTYVLELRVLAGALPQGIYEDTENPYHYFRVDSKGEFDRIIIGGEDHRSDIPVDTEKNFQSLKEYTEELLSDIEYTVVRQWSGPIIEPVDGLAFIGPHAQEGTFYATGFSGNGMTYSIIAADIITTIIQGSSHRWLDLYDANRTPSIKSLAAKGRDYTQELFGGAVKNTLRFKK